MPNNDISIIWGSIFGKAAEHIATDGRKHRRSCKKTLEFLLTKQIDSSLVISDATKVGVMIPEYNIVVCYQEGCFRMYYDNEYQLTFDIDEKAYWTSENVAEFLFYIYQTFPDMQKEHAEQMLSITKKKRLNGINRNTVQTVVEEVFEAKKVDFRLIFSKNQAFICMPLSKEKFCSICFNINLANELNELLPAVIEKSLDFIWGDEHFNISIYSRKYSDFKANNDTIEYFLIGDDF